MILTTKNSLNDQDTPLAGICISKGFPNNEDIEMQEKEWDDMELGDRDL